jgi:hypothetical protein
LCYFGEGRTEEGVKTVSKLVDLRCFLCNYVTDAVCQFFLELKKRISKRRGGVLWAAYVETAVESSYHVEYMKLFYNVLKIQNIASYDQGCGPASLKCRSVSSISPECESGSDFSLKCGSGIRIRILLLIKIIRICDYGSIDLQVSILSLHASIVSVQDPPLAPF